MNWFNDRFYCALHKEQPVQGSDTTMLRRNEMPGTNNFYVKLLECRLPVWNLPGIFL